jgi:hypothetical protein
VAAAQALHQVSWLDLSGADLDLIFFFAFWSFCRI